MANFSGNFFSATVFTSGIGTQQPLLHRHFVDFDVRARRIRKRSNTSGIALDNSRLFFFRSKFNEALL